MHLSHTVWVGLVQLLEGRGKEIYERKQNRYHVHDFIALRGLPRRLEREKAHPWFCQMFEKPMVLLDQIVKVFPLP